MTDPAHAISPIDDALTALVGAFAKNSIVAKPALESDEDWNRVVKGAPYCPALYSPKWNEYFEAYCSKEAAPSVPLSTILYKDNQPVGIWPLYLYERDGAWHPGSCGGDVAPPVIATGVGEKVVKAVASSAIEGLELICRRFDQPSWKAAEICFGGCSVWHRKLVESGAEVRVSHELYLDLAPDLDTIKACFRKSYRSLINQGRKLWKVETHAELDPAVFEELRLLHLRVAGRVTRSSMTWELQAQAIVRGECFMVSARDASGIMVGGALFAVSKTEGQYAVGAYDRALFDKPLGHVLQLAAVEHLKARGARWYRIGPRTYRATHPEATEKELSISYYKEGFASHMFPVLCTELRVKP